VTAWKEQEDDVIQNFSLFINY